MLKSVTVQVRSSLPEFTVFMDESLIIALITLLGGVYILIIKKKKKLFHSYMLLFKSMRIPLLIISSCVFFLMVVSIDVVRGNAAYSDKLLISKLV